MLKQFFSFILLLFCSFQLIATEVVVSKITTPKDQLVFDILKLALSKSPGERQPATQRKESINKQIRTVDNIEDIKSGKVSVIWAATNSEYERELLPIRLPILKGLPGHRIFIIRNGEQQQFAGIHTAKDLERLTAGQGRFWEGADIFKESGLPTITTLKDDNLFAMLEGDRFDYFPRAIYEPWSEVQEHSGLNLAVEEKLLLVYPYALYFFVSRENPQLAKQIESGFEKALADGSFNELFYSNPLIRSTLEQATLHNRTVIRLANHHLPSQTPLNRKELWLDINEIQATLNHAQGQLAHHLLKTGGNDS